MIDALLAPDVRLLAALTALPLVMLGVAVSVPGVLGRPGPAAQSLVLVPAAVLGSGALLLFALLPQLAPQPARERARVLTAAAAGALGDPESTGRRLTARTDAWRVWTPGLQGTVETTPHGRRLTVDSGLHLSDFLAGAPGPCAATCEGRAGRLHLRERGDTLTIALTPLHP